MRKNMTKQCLETLDLFNTPPTHQPNIYQHIFYGFLMVDFPDREKITNKAITINPRLGLGSHVAGVMVEAHGRCAAVLVQDLFAEATARRVVLGDHVIRCRLATKLRASQGAQGARLVGRAWRGPGVVEIK